MILYHSSTVPIEKFYVPFGGLHLGGLYSSLECALRKLRSHQNVDDACTVYIHKCEVDLGRIVLMDDLGSDDAWREVFSTEYDSVQYRNAYEPDFMPSYMVWDASRVTIISCDPVHMDEAEDTIGEMYDI